MDSTGNPRVAVAVAPDPVVSPVAAVIVTVGVAVLRYVPALDTIRASTFLPISTDRFSPVPAESVTVVIGAPVYPVPLLVIVTPVIAPAEIVTFPVAVTPWKNMLPEPTPVIGTSVPLFAFDCDDATLNVSASTRIA